MPPLAIEGLPRGGNGNVDILLGGLGDGADDLLGGGVDDLEGLLVYALDELIVDEAEGGRRLAISDAEGTGGINVQSSWLLVLAVGRRLKLDGSHYVVDIVDS